MNQPLNAEVPVSVADSFGAARDPALPSVAAALEPRAAQHELQRLERLSGPDGRVCLRAIRVVRHKPGRRCIIEYDVDVRRGRDVEALTVIGKVRTQRFGKSGDRMLKALWDAGFDAASTDGVSVPPPLGTISAFHMGLQRKVPGLPASALLAAPGAEELMRRIAQAAHKLHSAGIAAEREHNVVDELRILHERLPQVALAQPALARAIDKLLAACDQLGTKLADGAHGGIHRDFYADQIIVDGPRLYLIDFDLYCRGDPALDIGNFLAHIAEQSLREFADPEALATREQALEDAFVTLTEAAIRPRVRAWRALTLARHVHLSTLFPERRHLTAALLDLSASQVAEAWHDGNV